MSAFINENFMLSNETARQLFHGEAEKLPIIDYHCHLSPREIAENIRFRDITQLWLVDGHSGDHYKWRAMRANGVPEEYITGDKSSWEKFEKWAATMPYLMRNPLWWGTKGVARGGNDLCCIVCNVRGTVASIAVAHKKQKGLTV